MCYVQTRTRLLAIITVAAHLVQQLSIYHNQCFQRAPNKKQILLLTMMRECVGATRIQRARHGSAPSPSFGSAPCKGRIIFVSKEYEQQVQSSAVARIAVITSGRQATFQWITFPRGRRAEGTGRRCPSLPSVHRSRKILWPREQRILGCRDRAGLDEWTCKSSYQTKSSVMNQSFMHGKLSPGKGGSCSSFVRSCK